MQEQPFTIRRLIAAQQGMLPAALWPQRTRRHLCLGGQPRRHSAAERVLHELPERGERGACHDQAATITAAGTGFYQMGSAMRKKVAEAQSA